MRERDSLRAQATNYEARNRVLENLNDEQLALIQTLSQKTEAAEERTQRQQDEISALRAHIAALYTSRSWKLTGPVRTLSILLRGAPAPAPPVPAPLPLPLPLPMPTTVLSEACMIAAPLPTGRRSLFVAADMPPLYDQHSGGLRLLTLIGMLAESGWSINFGSFSPWQDLPDSVTSAKGKLRYEEALHKHGVERILYGMTEIDQFLNETETRIDGAFLSFPAVANAIMPLVRARFPNALVAFDMVDFHGLRQEREALLQDDPVKLAEASRMRDLEVGLACAADVTLAVTGEERDKLLTHAPLACVKVLPNVFDIPDRSPPDLLNRTGLFFIGGFWHAPNGDGVLWFVEHVWPLIRKDAPEATFTIAGSNMGNDILALGAVPGIEVVGYVPEVGPVLDRHRVFVAPLRYGAGMKGKVGQSLACGLPVVATTVGAEGMDLTNGTNILVADEPQAFADAVIQLLRDDELWTTLSRSGRVHIEHTLSRPVVKNALMDIFNG
ncbi:glycosyltransferase [Gluconacetobacter tumulisoli]|uniref:Glycosyltransferase n=1 Tax=Gluconacetobacter tumulisoli TaxID=1286189 RepID=A0A7W4KA76_9PROT|nr:glycosyltransferase family 4 protein [Gluconacetobacter tumulisoli]MBB2203211.1 glycosyltransferase [Gluconacetobacter tumulisoli]